MRVRKAIASFFFGLVLAAPVGAGRTGQQKGGSRMIRRLFPVLFASLLTGPAAAVAEPIELFFSEYIEGTSNNKALEIFNGTSAAVDLAAGGYNVQMFFNGSATAGLTINLAGTIALGDVFVLANSSAAAAILAQADQTNGAGWFNGDDAVVLRRGTTIIDVIGQIGFDPGTEWGTGLTSTADNTLRRLSSILGGDPDGSDVFDPSREWSGFATDTFGGLGSHSIDRLSVPEPGTLALLGLGLAGLVTLRRRRL